MFHSIDVHINVQEETQAFAGLVQAMYDTNTVAIVRRCFSARSSPEIGFLRPQIEHDHIVSEIRMSFV
jgi:hypothetical protein